MSNIRNILETICHAANESLQNHERRSDEWVVLSNIMDHDGSSNEAIRDKVVMLVYNVTRENMASSYTPARAGPDSFAIVRPPIYVVLYVMFMANFSGNNYSDGLAALSRIISFFQQNPSFSQSNLPDLDPGVDRLTLEMETLSPIDVNYVMGILGTKYLPSVYYKLRLLPFAANAMQARTYGVMGQGVTEAPGN